MKNVAWSALTLVWIAGCGSPKDGIAPLVDKPSKLEIFSVKVDGPRVEVGGFLSNRKDGSEQYEIFHYNGRLEAGTSLTSSEGDHKVPLHCLVPDCREFELKSVGRKLPSVGPLKIKVSRLTSATETLTPVHAASETSRTWRKLLEAKIDTTGSSLVTTQYRETLLHSLNLRSTDGNLFVTIYPSMDKRQISM